MGFSDTIEANVLSAIQAQDASISSLTDDDKAKIHSDWGKSAWRAGCIYAKAEDPSKVDEGDIVTKAIDPVETSAYWGMNHFKPEMRNSLLNGSSLFPYYGMMTKLDGTTASESRIIVITTNKIFRFDTANTIYFNSVKDNIKDWIAADYFTHHGDSTNSTNATNIAEANYDDETD